MKIENVRKKIDDIDRELLGLLEERMELGLRASRLKNAVEDLSREEVVLSRAGRSPLALVQEPFAEQLFKVIIEESKRLQNSGQKLVAFQGEHGAYSEVAARTLIPNGAFIPCAQFRDVFKGVSDGSFDCGAVPVENSLEGAISEVNDLLTRTDLHVIGEAKVPVHHCLLTPDVTDHREIRAVYSHPQALAQCRGFLERNNLEPRPFYDTAGAAKMLLRDRKRAAAVASPLCAELYGMNILKEHIEDDNSNSTRFLLLAKEPQREKGNKCSVVFVTAHQSGKLFEVLELFAEAGINLTRIASMPYRKDPGNYSFFLDFEGASDSEKVAPVLKNLRERASTLRLLGCYPKA